MSKLLKKLLFWLFIVLVVISIGFLGTIAYTDANCTRGVNYIVEKYKIDSFQLKAVKYQEYIYEDIADCDNLWLQKCTSEENLLFEYTLEDDKGNTMIIKEYKDGIFTDNYEKGIIRKEWLKKNNEKDK